MYQFTSAVSHYVNQLSKLVVSLCFGIAFVLTVYQVFSRFVLNSEFMLGIFPGANRLSFTWIEEMIRYLFIWGVFVGAALVYKLRGHATVDMLNHVLPTKWKTGLMIVSELICIGFFVLLAVKGLDMAQVAKMQVSPSLGINMFYMYISIVVCSVFCLIHSVHFLLYRLSGRAESEQGGTAVQKEEVHA